MWKRLVGRIKEKRGYTLAELLAVLGVTAILCAVVFPAIGKANRELRLARNEEYARTIFLAAQANLSRLRSQGALDRVTDAPPAEESRADGRVYALSGSEVYDRVLPVNSVEPELRESQVLIEYDPRTGNVFAVFYCEDEDVDLEALYLAGFPNRAELLVGVYEGSGRMASAIEPLRSTAVVEFSNGEEAVVTVKISLPEAYYHDYPAFAEGLEVILTVTGELSGGQTRIKLKTRGDAANCALAADGRTVLISGVLDSLADCGSFANLVMLSGGSDIHLTQIRAESEFAILPGENVTLRAEAEFDGGEAVEIEPGILPGVNPLFDQLVPGTRLGRYILAVSNGRNLQNLNVLAPSVAERVETVVFTGDISWADTTAYYDERYGGADGAYSSSGEAPARCLPYFVPISNGALFGAAHFEAGKTPELRERNGTDYADVQGNGCKVSDLVIDAAGYVDQTISDGYYVTADSVQSVNYHFTGLFSYANTHIDGLYLVDPVVRGYFGGEEDITATGALLGVCGSGALVTNCGVYPESGAQSGVSGSGAVGGLVGWCASRRTADGLAEELTELTFIRCFSAVRVSGQMSGGEGCGYTTGVGGFIGYAQTANCFACYASGDVSAAGCYVQPVAGASDDILKYDGAASAGAGGFAGTSHGTQYSSCFATGDVTGTGSGTGGFVGVMCYDVESSGQRTVFDSCYSTGVVTAGESFSGANARIGNGAEDFCPDYYQLLAAYYDAHGSVPPDTARWLYKDCYYLSRDSGGNENSNACADAAGYDLLASLHTAHRDGPWLEDRVAAIGQYTTEDGERYLSAYDWSALARVCREQLKEGFPESLWASASASTTDGYPFSIPAGMDYYGDWAERPVYAGIAYYEDYVHDTEDARDFRGFWFDSQETSTLLDGQEQRAEGYTVVSDGYAVLTASGKDRVTVRVEGSSDSYSLTGRSSGTWSDTSRSFAVYPLTEEIMDAASAAVTGSNYYVRLTVTVTPEGSSSGERFTMYFNPNTARSQLDTEAENSIPAEIAIRTARQLAALGRSEFAWSSDYHYIQELDIDCNADETLSGGSFAAIGNEDTPFRGSYTSAPGCSYTIKLHRDASSGLFGVIGPEGSVENLTLRAEDISIDGTAGIFAGTIQGTVKNMKLDLTGTVTFGTEQAGIFAGEISSGGRVDDSAVVADGAAVSGKTVAGFAAVIAGAVENCRVTPAAEESAPGYRGGSNGGLTIGGGTAAGFAVTITGTVTDCNALGTISAATASAFADTNEGVIAQCIANVTMSGGSAWVRSNSGIVQDSYGWYGGTAPEDAIAVPDSGGYVSCYFAAMNGTATALFDSGGAYSAVMPRELAAALEQLGTAWTAPGGAEAYPYSDSLSEEAYGYPMLRAHCGDWFMEKDTLERGA